METKLVPAICTQCGAQITVDSQKEAAICACCGTAFIVSKAIEKYNISSYGDIHIENAVIQNGPSASNLVKRAKQFEAENNIDLALEYYNRALDIDADYVEALEGIKNINDNKVLRQIDDMIYQGWTIKALNYLRNLESNGQASEKIKKRTRDLENQIKNSIVYAYAGEYRFKKTQIVSTSGTLRMNYNKLSFMSKDGDLFINLRDISSIGTTEDMNYKGETFGRTEPNCIVVTYKSIKGTTRSNIKVAQARNVAKKLNELLTLARAIDFGGNEDNSVSGNIIQPSVELKARTVTSEKKKESRLSILALIFAIITYTFYVGLGLAIYDLRKGKGDGCSHKGSWAAIIWSFFIIFVLIFGTGTKNSTEIESKTSAVESISSRVAENDNIDSVPATETVVIAPNMKDMKLQEIGKADDIYIGLSYVKVSPNLPTALGTEEVDSNHEVILAYFDIYNGGNKEKSVRTDDISCYADGNIVDDVESYFKLDSDGIGQFYIASLEAGKKLITCNDYEVPKGWNELKFFYQSTCIWTVTSGEVSNADFEFSSMYDESEKQDVTSEDSIVYSGKYELMYKGYQQFSKDILGKTENYVIVKLRINNTSNEKYDCSLSGYKMQLYVDDYLIDDADYILDDKIDGFNNIFNIDSVESGMSANIYVAFEYTGNPETLYFVYNDGYIVDGEVCKITLK